MNSAYNTQCMRWSVFFIWCTSCATTVIRELNICILWCPWTSEKSDRKSLICLSPLLETYLSQLLNTVCCNLFSQLSFGISVEVHSASTNFTSKNRKWKFCILNSLKLFGTVHATLCPHKGVLLLVFCWNVWFAQKISYHCSLNILSLKEFFLVLVSWEVSRVRWLKKPCSHASCLSVPLEIKIKFGLHPWITQLNLISVPGNCVHLLTNVALAPQGKSQGCKYIFCIINDWGTWKTVNCS